MSRQPDAEEDGRGAERCSGLPPAVGISAEILILGSFPSRLSLLRNEYYGNEKNQFWRMMEALFGISCTLPYHERVLHLTRHRVALWDVISSCVRAGSADGMIRAPLYNDLGAFIRSNPSLRLIALNGRAAGMYYSRMDLHSGVPVVILPSTSPANARITFAEKRERWEQILPGPLP